MRDSLRIDDIWSDKKIFNMVFRTVQFWVDIIQHIHQSFPSLVEAISYDLPMIPQLSTKPIYGKSIVEADCANKNGLKINYLR